MVANFQNLLHMNQVVTAALQGNGASKWRENEEMEREMKVPFNISFPMIFPDSYQIITDSSRHL